MQLCKYLSDERVRHNDTCNCEDAYAAKKERAECDRCGVLNFLSFQVSTTQIRITLFRETQNCVHEYSTTILALPMHETDFDQY
jgi:hypothetical protein